MQDGKPADEPKDTGQSVDVQTPPRPQPVQQRGRRRLWLIGLAIVLLVLVALAAWLIIHKSDTTQTNKSAPSSLSAEAKDTKLTLDTSKKYGNKYAGGMLPVGDGKYVTDGPKQGYIYACSQYAHNLGQEQGGAMTRGPWFSSDGKTWNIKQKISVSGSVHWQGSYSDTINGDMRTITSNDLPLDHTTGIFPIQTGDPAYQYDRNPNSIKSQSYTYALTANPTYLTTPNCIGGQIGVMNSGVALFSAFDAGGRDAGAWETQDDCQGHPQNQGAYHYHTLSSCIKNASVDQVIGFALDGFAITGPKVGDNNYLTTSDLDECHGLTSQIILDGKKVTTYHYVMTEDFPYSVSCYRGTATQPPGQEGQQQAQQSGQLPHLAP
jgi:hypothetical protein